MQTLFKYNMLLYSNLLLQLPISFTANNSFNLPLVSHLSRCAHQTSSYSSKTSLHSQELTFPPTHITLLLHTAVYISTTIVELQLLCCTCNASKPSDKAIDVSLANPDNIAENYIMAQARARNIIIHSNMHQS